MSEKGGARTSKRQISCQRSSLCFLGFTFAIGAHSISEEVAGFSPLWFPRGKLFVSLVSCDVLVFDCCTCYSLSKDPNIMLA